MVYVFVFLEYYKKMKGMFMTIISIEADGFEVEIRKEKNLHMEGKYIIIEFEDGYQSSLMDQYGWSREEAENNVDKVIEKKLKENGGSCEVHWEDRELFLIENPTFSVSEVAKIFVTIFPNSTIMSSQSKGIISTILKKLRRSKD
jgi:hypothetical protein